MVRTRQDRLLIVLCLLGVLAGFLLAKLLDERRAAAAPVMQPAVAACYATDGVNVETTYLGTNGAYIYPGPSTTEIEPLDDGAFVVHHSTRFVPVGARVYLPGVSNE